MRERMDYRYNISYFICLGGESEWQSVEKTTFSAFGIIILCSTCTYLFSSFFDEWDCIACIRFRKQKSHYTKKNLRTDTYDEKLIILHYF